MKAVAVVMLTLALGLGACAEDPRVAEEAARAAAAAARPWEPARVTLDAATARIKAAGVRAVAPLVPDLEAALAEAPAAIARGKTVPPRVLLADGPAEMTAATQIANLPPLPDKMGAKAPDKAGGKDDGKAPPPPAVTVLESPYPLISMILGSYYLETRDPAAAVRVLEAGLALPPAVPDIPRPMMVPLASERATALGAAGRWQDALVAWERLAKTPDLDVATRARILRGRAVALIELKRINEAELTLRAALALEPDNALTRNELDYVAALRGGGAARPVRASQPGARGVP